VCYLHVRLTDPHAGQDVRTSGRNEDLPFAEGLVAVGPAKRTYWQVALPGHLQVSAHQSAGYDIRQH